MDYVTFYSKHVDDLRQAAKQYLGWCPFHADKGSSQRGFSLNPEDGLWYCHTCGTGGDSITFCIKKGLELKESPDYDPSNEVYVYAKGVRKKRSLERDDRGKPKTTFWEGPREARNKHIYNPMALDIAKEQGRLLWICEGEKDTQTMMEEGELAIGIPSTTADGVLSGASFAGIPQVIVAMDNDQEGRSARNRILERFPNMSWVEWPSVKPEGYDVTDLSKDDPGEFVETMMEWTVNEETQNPLSRYLTEKQQRDMSREPGKLLGYDLTKFPELAKKIDGVQPGLYVIYAEPTVAKTAFLCNLTLDLIDSNHDLTGFYFSLDDNKDVVINRFLSILTNIPLESVQRLKNYDEDHCRLLNEAYDFLRKLSKEQRIFMWDASDVNDVGVFEKIIEQRIQNRRVFVIVDSLHNLGTQTSWENQRRENVDVSSRMKRVADAYRIPVVCTAAVGRAQVGTGGKDKVPAINTRMEIDKWANNINLLLFLSPQSQEDYERNDQPIIKMRFAKNKLSRYRNTVLLKFHRSTSRVVELEEKTPSGTLLRSTGCSDVET